LNKEAVKRIKRNGVTQTKSYKMASRIQANVKGFLFRRRRKVALKRLEEAKKNGKQKRGGGEEIDEMDELEQMFSGENMDKEFDAEAFLDVKMVNLEKADIFAGASESLMDKYVQMMAQN